ncbi:MAG: PAS domain S-box protein, partial [Ktedonobacterales bacterium]
MGKGTHARAHTSRRAPAALRAASRQPDHKYSTQPDDSQPQRTIAVAAHERAILESALDCIITIDARGAVVEFNPAAERTFGYRRDDVLGKEMAQFIVPPTLREQHRAGLAHYLATGEGALIRRRVEVTAMRSDGSQFPVELAITPATSNGETLFVAYLRDITERKQAEAERQRLHELERDARADAERRERQLRAVFDAMTDGVAMYGEDGRIVSINPAMRRMIGVDSHPEYEALPLARRSAWLKLSDVSGAPLNVEQWPPTRVLNGEVLVSEQAADIIAHTLDGRDIEFSVTGAPVRDSDARVVGAVCVYHDIAARRLIERQTLAALHALMRCADVVTAHTTSETTADLLARLAAALLDLEAADFTHALLIDPDGHLTPAGIHGVSPEDEAVWRQGLAQFDPARIPHLDEVTAILSTGKPLLQHFDADTPLISTATVASLHIRAAITGPVVVEGQIVGLLTISRTRPLEPGSATYFAPWDLDLIADVGRLAGQAIAQARLGEQLTSAEAARL